MSSIAELGSHDPLIAGLRRSGLVTLLVLHCLADQPRCGHQLIDRISALSAGVLKVNPNTMYPLLRTIEARGLVTGEWEHPDRRTRRCYRLTATGETERLRLARRLEPRLQAVAAAIELLRDELLAP